MDDSWATEDPQTAAMEQTAEGPVRTAERAGWQENREQLQIPANAAPP